MWGIKLTLVIFLQIQAILACNPAMTCEQICSYKCKWPACGEQQFLNCQMCRTGCINKMTEQGQCGEEVQKMGRIMKESIKIFLNRMIDGYLGDEEMVIEEYYNSSSNSNGMYVVPKKYRIKLIIQSQKRNVPLTHVF